MSSNLMAVILIELFCYLLLLFVLIDCTTERMPKNSATISDRLSSILSDLSSFVGQDSSSAAPICDSRDLDSFVKRVHSFQSSSWFAKPRWLSPVICARYGWVNVDEDLLHCVGCQAVLVVRTPSSFDPAIYDACQKRLEDQLKRAAHHPCCTWPSCPTPEVIIHVHSGSCSQAVVVEDFVNKAQLLYSVGKDLPAIERSFLNVTEADVTALCSLVRSSPRFLHDCKDPDALRSAVLLALTGWDLSDGGKAFPGCTSVQCSLCMRQPGLWNYISVTSGNDRGSCVDSQNNTESLLDLQTHTGNEAEDLQTAGGHSECDLVSVQVSPDEADSMQLATDDTNSSALVEGLPLSQNIEVINDMQDELLSNSSNDDEPYSLAVNSNKDDDSETITNDMLGMTDTDKCEDHSDMAAVADESGFLPSEYKNCTASAVGEVEHCTELIENLDGNENVACDRLQMTDCYLPSDAVQQEPVSVDTDVIAETEVEHSKDDSGALDVGAEFDNRSNHNEATFDAASSDAEDIMSDAANILTAHDEQADSGEPRDNVSDCSPDEFMSSVKNVKEEDAHDEQADSGEPRDNVSDCSTDEFMSSVKNVKEEDAHDNSSNPEDLSCTSLEPRGISVEFLDEAVHESDSLIQCDEQDKSIECYQQQSLQKSADADAEAVALDLTSTIW